MIRIHTEDSAARWRFKCSECRSVDWRVHDGTVGCRDCGSITTQLWDAKSEQNVERSEIERVPRDEVADQIGIATTSVDGRVQRAKANLLNACETLELVYNLGCDSKTKDLIEELPGDSD